MEMIKKLMVFFVVAMAAIGAWAATETVNGIEWTYTVTDGKASVGEGWGSSAIPSATTGAITIPSTIGGYPVTSIGNYAFYNCSSVTSVTIPDSVTNIEYDAFYGCEALAEVSLPDGLTGDIKSAFSRTPFIISDTFPEFILSRSGKSLYGTKAKMFDSAMDWDDVWAETKNVEILVPATVECVCDYALGALSVFVYDAEGDDYYESYIDVGRIIFTGGKPNASEQAFKYRWGDGIVDKVYYYQGKDGWTFGENWCGVKTYALDKAPDEFTVDSSLKFGKVYGGGMWDGSRYSEREIWEASAVESGLLRPGEKGGEYALIPVEGSGTITPIIYGDKKYVSTVEVWTDSQMFEKFTPKGVSSSEWDDDYDYWEYESGIKCYYWPKSVWPDNKVVSGRRWIVVGISQNLMAWAGRSIFRVGVVGGSELSESVVVKMSDAYLNPPLSDFFHGMSISGIQHFNCFDAVQRADPMYERPDGTIGERNIYAPTFEFFRLDDKALTFNIEVPSAGTLVVSSDDDYDDSPALRDVFSVTGNNILTDVFTEKSHNWEDDNYSGEETNFWKTSYAPWIRRIEVSAKTTLKFTRKNTDDCDCEFNRMYFFPKNEKSVAIGVDYVSVYDPDGDWWEHGYLQGYVEGMGVYKSGETATLTAVPCEGEQFDHWEVCFGNLELTESQKKSATLSFKVTDAMCGNMEDEEQIYIQVVWKPKYSILALPSIAGAGTVTGSGSYYEGETVTLKATAATGCTFIKWSDGETSPSRTIEVVPADVERVIFACFEAPNGVPNPTEWIVTFDANGGEVAESERGVKKGTAVGALPTPTRSKYKFLGWYTAPEGGTKISATTKVTGDVTYYAQWVYDGSAIVSAVVAEGCEAMGKVSGGKTAKAGTKLTLKATANKGYVFAGWNGPIDDTVDPRNPSLSYVIGEDDAEFIANFIPVSEDWVYVWMGCNDGYVTNEEISDIYIGVDSGSLATLKVTGFPTGLKYTAKPVYDRNGELLHEANTIYGTPTKSGVYTVTVTATTAGKKTDTCSAVIVVRKDGERMVKITVPTWHDGETDTDVIPGKVTGAGIYAEGKKVTLKATANKGFVFAGWRDVNSGDWLSSDEDYRSPSLSYIMTDSDMEIEAVFESVEYDDTLVAYVDGNEITSNATDNNFVAEGTTILPLEMESISIPKAAVSELPAGMKYTDKALTVKVTKTEEAYDVPASAIYGTPTKPGLYTVTVKLTNTTIKKAIEKKFTIEVPNFTAANGYFVDYLCNDAGEKYTLSVGITNIDEFLPSLALKSEVAKLAVSGLPAGLKYDAKTGKITGIATKPGTYTVTLTVTDGKAKYVSTITIEVEALPEILVGTYTGLIGRDVNVEKEDPWMAYGMANVTVAANGKITAKMTLPCGTYSFSAAGWDYVEDGVYSAVLQTKNGDEFELVIDSKRDWKDIAEDSALRVNGYKEFRVPIWRNEHVKGGNIESDPVANELISEIKALKKVAFKVEGSKSSGYEVTEVAANDRSANLTVTFDTKGGVKYAGNIDGVRVSGSSFLGIDGDDYYTICDIVVPVGKTESVYIAFGIERDEDGELQFEVFVVRDEF